MSLNENQIRYSFSLAYRIEQSYRNEPDKIVRHWPDFDCELTITVRENKRHNWEMAKPINSRAQSVIRPMILVSPV